MWPKIEWRDGTDSRMRDMEQIKVATLASAGCMWQLLLQFKYTKYDSAINKLNNHQTKVQGKIN